MLHIETIEPGTFSVLKYKTKLEADKMVVSDKNKIALQISSILQGGNKTDFFSIAEYLSIYSIDDLISCYNEKFPANHMMPISIPLAFTYFADADESDDTVSLKGQTWTSVKKQIQEKVGEYLKY